MKIVITKTDAKTGEKKDITSDVALKLLHLGAFVGVGYLCYKIGWSTGYDGGWQTGFNHGFEGATEIIHDSIVGLTDTVRLKGSGKIVDLGRYLEITGGEIESSLAKHIGKDIGYTENLKEMFR